MDTFESVKAVVVDAFVVFVFAGLEAIPDFVDLGVFIELDIADAFADFVVFAEDGT